MVMANPDMLPPGFRFHPTDEELILHYLRNRAANAPCPVAIIADVDIYKFDPWDLPSRAAYGDKEWYFFSPRDRKYPNGIRPNRAAGSGYWKATGTDKPIHSSTTAGESVGVKKALVFYEGRPPKGTKTNWIMHEYRLAADAQAAHAYRPMKFRNASMRLDDWVLCRIYKKASCQVPAMAAVPQLSDHDQDEHCGFDDNPYAAMLLQGASYSYPAPPHAAAGAQRMPRIPSLTELFNDPSLAHFFEEGGGMQDMARLSNPQQQQQQQHAPLLGRPVTSQQLLLNNGQSMSGGQTQIPQMDPHPPAAAASTLSAAAENKRKRSSTTGAGAQSSSQASEAKKPNGSCFGATFQIGNGLQGSSLGHHHMPLHSNMGTMN